MACLKATSLGERLASRTVSSIDRVRVPCTVSGIAISEHRLVLLERRQLRMNAGQFCCSAGRQLRTSMYRDRQGLAGSDHFRCQARQGSGSACQEIEAHLPRETVSRSHKRQECGKPRYMTWSCCGVASADCRRRCLGESTSSHRQSTASAVLITFDGLHLATWPKSSSSGPPCQEGRFSTRRTAWCRLFAQLSSGSLHTWAVFCRGAFCTRGGFLQIMGEPPPDQEAFCRSRSNIS